MSHVFTYSDGHPSCLICGADFDRDDVDIDPCSGRRDLIHGDIRETGHDVDCDACATENYCERAAAAHGCDCCACRS